MKAAWIVSAIGILYGFDASAVQRVVGVSAPTGGATLVKHLHVAAGSEVGAIEFVTNDRAATFPAVRLRRFTAGRIGEVLCEVRDVAPSAGERHRLTVSVPRLYFADAEDVVVEIVLPPTTGIARVGEGAGVVADERAGEPATSYIGSVAGNQLLAIDADLVVLLTNEAGAAGKAAGVEPPAGSSDAAAPSIELRTDATGALEVHVSGVRADTRVDVYDVNGRRVRGLDRAATRPASHVFQWDRRNSDGHRVAAGVYFISVRAGTLDIARKVVVVR
jgi:hypothetical protein